MKIDSREYSRLASTPGNKVKADKKTISIIDGEQFRFVGSKGGKYIFEPVESAPVPRAPRVKPKYNPGGDFGISDEELMDRIDDLYKQGEIDSPSSIHADDEEDYAPRKGVRRPIEPVEEDPADEDAPFEDEDEDEDISKIIDDEDNDFSHSLKTW